MSYLKPVHTWKLFTFLLAAILVILLPACKTATKITGSHPSSLDWQGSYSGMLPCADCEGIATTIVLNADRSYSINTRHIGKNETANPVTGTFTWHKENNIIRLKGTHNKFAFYKISEGQLIQLDQKGQLITGKNAHQYELAKENEITNKYWKLIEVMGQPVTADDQQKREPHMILHTAENRVTGHSGCNNFSGTYELNNNRIRFSPLVATKMACINSMQVENNLIKAITTADSYHISGDSLQLFKARMAPLAKFVAVYLR